LDGSEKSFAHLITDEHVERMGDSYHFTDLDDSLIFQALDLHDGNFQEQSEWRK
jgi:hypothetical protein